MKNEIAHDIRYTQISDEKFLLSWMSEKEMYKWFPVRKEKEIIPFVKNWIGFSKFRSSLTATVNDVPCGIGTLFLMPYKKISHQCFFYLAVNKNYQKMGIGSSLVKNLINLSKNYFRHEQIYAEIFDGCFIEKILRSCGFQEFARQKGYVFEDNAYKDRICFDIFF